MKALKNVLLYTSLTLVSIVAFIFGFVEFRSLFAGDFCLFNNVFVGFLTYFFRGFYFLLIITLVVFIILFKTHHKKICIILFAGALSLFVGALLTLLFYDYFVSLAIIFITALLVIITSVGFFQKDKPESCPIK